MTNITPLITIVTPSYNSKKLLEKAILSVINQNQDIPFKWELIIVDDGSKDQTKDYIKKYLDNYSNIKYFYINNSGMNNARNFAFDNMGKDSNYIMFLDADDEIKVDCIKNCLYKYSELTERGLYNKVFALFFFAEDENGNLIGSKNLLKGKNEIFIDYKMYLDGFLSFESGFFYKSEYFLNNQNRFDKDVPSGGTSILLAKWWKKELKENKNLIIFFDYIGRIYRQNNGGRLTFEFTKNKKRFYENALSSDRVIKIIGSDLLELGYKRSYASIYFKIGVNYLLYGDKKKGLKGIKTALKYDFKIIYLLIFLLSLINIKLIYYTYKYYVLYEYKT